MRILCKVLRCNLEYVAIDLLTREAILPSPSDWRDAWIDHVNTIIWVSNAEACETVPSWGKMRALDEVLRDAHPGHEAKRFEKSWACTGCGACRELCLLDNPVADTLWDGRADAFANGLAPEPARTVAADFPTRLQRLAHASRALGFSPDGALGAAAATTVVLPGCTAVATDPDEARDAVRAVAGLRPSRRLRV